MTSLPTACTLTSRAAAERRRAWQALADHALVERRNTERGVQLSCAFADWRVEPYGDEVILAVTAPEDSAPALQAIFA